MLEVVLGVPLRAGDFHGDYRRRLFAAGWREDDEFGPGRRGFVPHGLPGLFVRAAHRSPWLERRLRGRVPGLPRLFPDVLRLGEHGPLLIVDAADRRDAPTDVRLRVRAGGRSRRVHHDPVWETLPSLLPPPRTSVRRGEAHTGLLRPTHGARETTAGGGAGWEPDGAYSHATLETELDLEALVSHYTAQLERAGWSRTDEGSSGPQSWSTWTFIDAEGGTWSGTFGALRLAGTSPRYLSQVHATRAPDGRSSSP